MMYVESDKVYGLKKAHKSDTITLCAKRALRACKQGDGIFCKTLSEVTIVKRLASKQKIKITMRKQECGGWILFPLFYKSATHKAKYIQKYGKIYKNTNEHRTDKEETIEDS